MRFSTTLIASSVVVALAAGCGSDDESEQAAGTTASTQAAGSPPATQARGRASGDALTGEFMDADRQGAGTVRVTPAPGGTGIQIEAEVRGLEPGFHGFHVHETGACEPPMFESAKGHVRTEGQVHGEHDGDLPSLYADKTGTARLRTVTDRLTIDQLSADDGVAVMVHAGTDNFADIPSRYGEPDEETENTGDAGSRVACATFGEPAE